MQRNVPLFAGLSAGFLLLLCGCADRNGNGQPDSVDSKAVSQVETQIKQGAVKVEAAAKPLADQAKQNVGAIVKNPQAAASNLGAALTITPKVKGAIMADDMLKARKIDVDTFEAKKTVALRGRVKTIQEKQRAEQLAKKYAPEYKIDDQLKVTG